MEWNEQKAQEIVNKHKKSFTFRLTFKIIRVLLAVFLVYSIYMVIISLAYEFSHTGARTEFYQKMAIDWTYPELSGGFSEGSHDISPLLTQKITVPLEKRIGKSNYLAGELKLQKPLLTSLTFVDIEQTYMQNIEQENFHFPLPVHPETRKKIEKYQDEHIWETLDMVHEGFVANMSFSTLEYYSPLEIIDLLSPYDVDILWMPLYMGELKDFQENLEGNGDSVSFPLQFGLSPARDVTDDYQDKYMIGGLDEGSIAESEEMMLKHMQTMLQEKTRMAEKILGTAHLQERYDYLNEHGFQVFGAVITGPVKELLKLQDLDGIHHATLGEMTYWNWE